MVSIFKMTGIPTLSIPPDDKWSQGLAMIQFLKARGLTFELSRLTLVVVTGLFQSLVEAMPQRIGLTCIGDYMTDYLCWWKIANGS